MQDDHLIVFDFDGVIVNTLDLCVDINDRLNPHVSREEYISHFEGNIYDALKAKKMRSEAPGDAQKPPLSWLEEYEKGIHSHAPEEIMPEIIAELGQKYPLVVVSSTQSDLIKSFLETHGLVHYFQAILGSDVHTSKVVKIRSVLLQNGISPENAIMITDTLGDIREAAQCDVAAIGVIWGFHSKETLAKGEPFAIAEHPRDLPKLVEQYFKK